MAHGQKATSCDPLTALYNYRIFRLFNLSYIGLYVSMFVEFQNMLSVCYELYQEPRDQFYACLYSFVYADFTNLTLKFEIIMTLTKFEKKKMAIYCSVSTSIESAMIVYISEIFFFFFSFLPFIPCFSLYIFFFRHRSS